MNHSHSASGSLITTGGCGCGGSAGHGCSCGKQECQDCRTTALVRPHFFAGQLLTEDDLEALTTYVVAKQRLHTNHLHGAGVVCGLEVGCHPCDPGKVVVQPGYALDCCGNDIVVPCASDLDIIAMIRRLIVDKRGGYDCGDPCDDRKTKAKGNGTTQDPATRPAQSAVFERPVLGKGDDTSTSESSAVRFCLYVHYCEQQADPLKPYVLDEPCGAGAGCEHTRVREGYRFELRCSEEAEPVPTFQDRLKECSDPEELKKEIGSAQKRQFRYLGVEAAVQSASANEPIRMIDDDLPRFVNNTAVVQQFAERFAADAEDATTPDERELRSALDAFLDLSRVTALAQAAQAAGEPVPDAAKKRVLEARAILETAEPIVRRHVTLFEQSEDQLAAQAALEQGLFWTAPNVTAEARLSSASRAFLFGALFSRDLSNYDARQLAQLKDWLTRRLRSGVSTDCHLEHDVAAIRTEANSDAATLERTRSRLAAVLQRYLSSCFCKAILPPCPSCDDTGVLLACLTVEDCEIVDICNLERTFVLSWPLMRYWVPWFGELGDLFEQLCCPAVPAKPSFQTGGETRGSQLIHKKNNVFALSDEADRALVHRSSLESVLRFAVPEAQSSGAIARLTQVLDKSVVPPPGAVPLGLEEAVTPGGDRLADALRSPAPRRVLDDLIADRIDELRPTTDLKAVTDTVDDRFADVATALTSVRKELKRRPTATEITDLKAIKRLATADVDLRDLNKKLEKSNQELAARVADLARRLEQLETKHGNA